MNTHLDNIGKKQQNINFNTKNNINPIPKITHTNVTKHKSNRKILKHPIYLNNTPVDYVFSLKTALKNCSFR